MDELTRVIEHRPDDEPPTDAERASARMQLMAHIDQADATGERTAPNGTIDLRSHGRHRARWAAMASAAAIVALIAMAVSLSGNGPGPIADKPAAAAEQLRTIADHAAEANPYPSGTYAITSRLELHDSISVNGQPSGDSTHESTTYAAGGGNYISRAKGCATGTFCVNFTNSSGSGDPWIPGTGTAAEVRSGLERRVDDSLRRMDGDPSRAWAMISTAAGALQDPHMGPVGRAELLRIIAEHADLSSTTGETSRYGLRGTRFKASTPNGHMELLVDPTDGYVLELRMVGPSQLYTADESATDGYRIEIGQSDSTFSYQRPEAQGLPADVAALNEQIVSHQAAIEASWPNGGCAGGTGGNPGGQNWGIDIPDDLSFNHCWLP